MMIRVIMALVVGVVFANVAHARMRQQPATDREIAHVRGDLYRVRDGRQHTVFLATNEGIVVGDPLNSATAIWLKGELESRFPGVPVRFVLVTHHHYTRAEGLTVFTGATERVGQDRYGDALIRARRRFPMELAALDLDRNDTLDERELSNSADRAALIERDRNRDRTLTPRELYARVSDVERRFDRRWRIELGENIVEMVHVGSTHAPEMSLIFFPKQRIVFAAGIPPLTLQNGFGAFSPRDARAWATVVDALDFEMMLTSDGRSVPHAQITSFKRYVTDLLEAVADGYEAGHTAADLQSATLDAYRDTPFDLGRPMQIAAAFADLHLVNVHLYGAAMGRMVFPDARFCVGYSECDQTSRVSGVTVGLRTNVWRIGLVAEAMFAPQQRASARGRPWSFEHMVHRDTRGSLLASFGSSSSGFGLSALAGMSLTVTDTRGLATARGVIAPAGGRREIGVRDHQFGFTLGADISMPVGRKFALMVPLRLTRNSMIAGGNGVEPLDAQVGLGLSMRVSSRVNR